MELKTVSSPFTNPFRPGAGHRPPYLAGRKSESNEFSRLLQQDVILENLILTGLRGVGKTVLLDTFKPLAISPGWRWVGTDLSESSSISEDRMVLRLLTDLSVVTAAFQVGEAHISGIGFNAPTERVTTSLDFPTLERIFNAQPGLASDKLKAVLEIVWQVVEGRNEPGLVFAYDEAQNLSDQAEKDQYPLSLLLDVFQSIQRKSLSFWFSWDCQPFFSNSWKREHIPKGCSGLSFWTACPSQTAVMPFCSPLPRSTVRSSWVRIPLV